MACIIIVLTLFVEARLRLDEKHSLLLDLDSCVVFLEKLRWKDNPQCPYCKSLRNTPYPKEHRYHCNACNATFSVTVNTLFHHSHIPLWKWFLAIEMFHTEKHISIRELARRLSIAKSSAWLMTERFYAAMRDPLQRDLVLRIAQAARS